MSSCLVVVGDALLDRDVSGTVDRFCPDAPAPVFDEVTARDRPGGAALAAVLTAADGEPVRLVTAVGADDAGERLRELLAERGVELIELLYTGGTPEKIRLRSQGQTVLRLDRNSHSGEIGPLTPAALAALADAGAILVSDYGRGVSRLAELRHCLGVAAASRPVVWDPHPRGGSPIPGMRLVTPNENELPDDVFTAVSARNGNGHHPVGRLAELARRASATRRLWRASAIAVTLGADGAMMADGSGVPLVVPAPMRADGDPCGAGDRFAGAATQALAHGAVTSEAVQAAVAAATAYVAGGSAATVLAPARSAAGSGSGPAARQAVARNGGTAEPAVGPAAAKAVIAATRAAGGRVVATGGCFDLLHPGHIGTLQAARALGDCLIVCLNSDRSVRSIKGENRPVVGERDRARMLTALACVDAVVLFDEETPVEVLNALRPDIWVKGGDYTGEGLPESDHVARWGGQTVVVPYIAGHSTSRLITTLTGRSS
jgi:rfaE bifunctional protein nucleotidyltransferase chain/domain/rfaE bifunctional protein kinase chain/domain